MFVKIIMLNKTYKNQKLCSLFSAIIQKPVEKSYKVSLQKYAFTAAP